MASQPLLVRLQIGIGPRPRGFLVPQPPIFPAPSGVVDNRNGTFSITGGGVTILTGAKGGQANASVTGGGDILVNGRKGAAANVALTGGGDILLSAPKGAKLTLSLTGGGVVTITETTGRTRVGSITGGGDIVLQARKDVSYTIAITGGGVITIQTTDITPAAAIIVVTQDLGGAGPVEQRRSQTEFDDWTIQMDDEAIVEWYAMRVK